MSFSDEIDSSNTDVYPFVNRIHGQLEGQLIGRTMNREDQWNFIKR